MEGHHNPPMTTIDHKAGAGQETAYRIELSSGDTTLVDPDVWEWAAPMRWHLFSRRYAGTHLPGTTGITYLHSLILRPPPGFFTDHINRDTLDNRRANLRPVTPAQNAQNRVNTRRARFGVPGVYWSARDKAWYTQVRANGRRYYPGQFKRFEDAVAAVTALRAELHAGYAPEAAA
jgi:hypothetical protein